MSQRLQPQRLAGKLLAIRLHFGLSQSQMVQRLKCRFHYGRISEFELGKRQPSLLVLLAYARVARIHIDDLVDDEKQLSL